MAPTMIIFLKKSRVKTKEIYEVNNPYNAQGQGFSGGRVLGSVEF